MRHKLELFYCSNVFVANFFTGQVNGELLSFVVGLSVLVLPHLHDSISLEADSKKIA